MLFDDAEGLADPKADPDKEALILAGNRKGGAIPIRRPGLMAFTAYAMAECLLPTRIDSSTPAISGASQSVDRGAVDRLGRCGTRQP